ncbi:MAG: ribonuclease H-like domain-containing protein [Lachnospiraceae bacterium]|nr:ribonuclease H-like domain-containing protein [Lachnospiraceae bacterium]
MIHRITKSSINTLPLFQQHYLTEDMLLFDIETTGLSADRDSIYCIGCGYRMREEIVTELFFAEDRAQEQEVLAAFSGLLRNRPIILTFNGETFDIPFIRKRAALYDGSAFCVLSELRENTAASPLTDLNDIPLSAYISVDLYRKAAGMKALLRLPSYRQKSIEQFLGCSREDCFDGRQLIGIYHHYVSAPNPADLSLLLLHNEEDVRGIFDLIGLLSWYQLRDGAFDITDTCEETDEMCSFYNISISPTLPFVQSISLISRSAEPIPSQDGDIPGFGCSLLLGKETGLIRFPVMHGTLRHYFPDPENYYYLPEEDCAVHKSVGSFVDICHRKKATKQTCYSRQECAYITAPVKYAAGFLQRDFRDNNSYLTLPSEKKEVKQFLQSYFSLFFRL